MERAVGPAMREPLCDHCLSPAVVRRKRGLYCARHAVIYLGDSAVDALAKLERGVERRSA